MIGIRINHNESILGAHISNKSQVHQNVIKQQATYHHSKYKLFQYPGKFSQNTFVRQQAECPV